MMLAFFKTNKTLQQVEALTMARDFAQASQLLAPLISANPKDATLLLHAAVIEFERGDLQRAYEILAQALTLQPDNPVLHLAMGEVCYKQGKHEASIDALQQCLVLSPDNPKAEYLYGLNCIAQGRMDEATAHFEKVAREDQHFLQARLLTLGEAWLRGKS